MSAAPQHPAIRDCHITVAGTVQGVGYRPFVARLAARCGVSGWVRNDLHGVQIRAGAEAAALEAFTHALQDEAPPAARVTAVTAQPIAADTRDLPAAGTAFEILASPGTEGSATTSATPDLALCDDCRRELLDPRNRRHGYPFINCTNCGPRYSILLELPYDRPHTTMATFRMCPECAREYHDPADRRYHAQPNACPACGPHLELRDSGGRSVLARDSAHETPASRFLQQTPSLSSADLNSAALAAAAAALLAGRIVAVKGIGGFHLMVDATNDAAVCELRRRKHREEKPLAVMYPSSGDLRRDAFVGPAEEALLQSPAAPIILLRRRPEAGLAPAIAPGNPWIGALLPYSPLHHLLLARVARPLVATSANLSEEPLCIDNAEALDRLRGLADLFLVHDRPIARPVDDSVLRPAIDGPPIVLRRARGFAPSSFALPTAACGGEPILCVGGHMKNTVALATDLAVVLSPHIGDLATVASQQAFQRHIEWLVSLQRAHPRRIACDAHPHYDSTRYALASGLPVTTVQHHLAHVFACLLENHPDAGPEQVLGVSWDGTGYGADGTIWGGEFIHVDRRARTARRVACLRPFRLPGGDAAIRDPRRSALALLYELHNGDPEPLRNAGAGLGFAPAETETLLSLLASGAHAPVTTSAGRLFDGVAALLGLAQRNRFEGQAAMQLEFAADRAAAETGTLPFTVTPSERAGRDRLELDWRPALSALLELRTTHAADILAARFHRGLCDAITAVSQKVGVDTVALTGGCFQNRLLLADASDRLATAGFTVLRHRDLPPNDGNLAAGQALAARLGITEVR